MKDIRVEVKFKNNLLLSKIYEKFPSVKQFAEACGLYAPTVYNIINFRINIVTKFKNTGCVPYLGDLYFTPTVCRMAKALDCHPLQIIPEHLLEPRKNKFTLEIDSTQMIEYLDEKRYQPLIQGPSHDEVRQALSSLSPRERHIIEQRYGFDGHPKSLQDLGDELNVSRERVRQIEVKAKSKVRGHINRQRMAA